MYGGTFTQLLQYFFPTQYHLKWELLPFNFESAVRKTLFGAQIIFSTSSVLKHFFHCIVCVKLGSGIDTVCILVEMTPWKIQNWGCELYSDEKKMRRLQSLAMIPIWGRTGGIIRRVERLRICVKIGALSKMSKLSKLVLEGNLIATRENPLGAHLVPEPAISR